MKQFPPQRDYRSLSVKDLLDARDAYHLHLSHLTNVIATAVGRYRIHQDDWYAEHPPNEKRPADFPLVTEERRLDNSVVKPWSWPAVLVFVKEWVDRKEFAKSPDQMVPRALFLSDGRVVPTCVIRAVEQEAPISRKTDISFPNSIIGGGFAVVADVQGREHFGSVGCLVSDGDLTYALTSQHVTGEGGREIFSILRGRRERVGVSEFLQIRKRPFQDVYPGFAGTHVTSNLDVGLIRIDDVSRWTTNIASIGAIDLPVDLNTDTITLDLMGCPVRAFGASSGELYGEIQALFYRYKSIGGTEYVADLLIGPRKGKDTNTLQGDSGTVWCWEEQLDIDHSPTGKPEILLRPIAVQWGGHVLVEGSGSKQEARSYALATCLSTVCRELDVDVLRSWNEDLPQYWGDFGHYTIGAKACQILSGTTVVDSPHLGRLMAANLERISYKDQDIHPSIFSKLGGADFVPLADVPDKVWKMGGKGARGNSENPNHFADMDRPLPDNPDKGKTLLQICEDPAKIDVPVWQDYYTRVKDKSRGLLPFRTRQLYQTMVTALRREPADLTTFIFAGGVMAHYVGDACQPLHISYMYNGDPDTKQNGKPRGDGVHSAYETKMLNAHGQSDPHAHIAEVVALLNQELATQDPRPLVQSGREAAQAAVKLMQRTFLTLQPAQIIDAYVNDPGSLWNEFGEKTIKLLADGARTLATIWASAWAQGNGDRVTVNQLVGVSEDDLKTLYLDPGKAPSKTLDDIAPLLDDSI